MRIESKLTEILSPLEAFGLAFGITGIVTIVAIGSVVLLVKYG